MLQLLLRSLNFHREIKFRYSLLQISVKKSRFNVQSMALSQSVAGSFTILNVIVFFTIYTTQSCRARVVEFDHCVPRRLSCSTFVRTAVARFEKHFVRFSNVRIDRNFKYNCFVLFFFLPFFFFSFLETLSRVKKKKKIIVWPFELFVCSFRANKSHSYR